MEVFVSVAPSFEALIRPLLTQRPPSPAQREKGRRQRMTFPDIVPALAAAAPALRGRLTANAPLAPYTWFRVGGPAQILFQPADEEDLAYFLERLPREISVTTLGLGSNLIARDGGVAGVAIRLGGKAF